MSGSCLTWEFPMPKKDQVFVHWEALKHSNSSLADSCRDSRFDHFGDAAGGKQEGED